MSDSVSMSDNALTKMVIHAFSDKDFSDELDDLLFTVPVNPESFMKSYKVDLDERTGHGQPGTQPGYKSSSPQELKLDFVLDGTGTIQNYAQQFVGVSVHDQLTAFMKCVYAFNGDTHKPNYVIIIWGPEVRFPGQVSDVQVNHTLFQPNGDPLRVKISATFKMSESDQARIIANEMHSPDLTKRHTAQRGERLDLLTYKQYGDPDYLLQVGRVNNLVSIRNIPLPTMLYFPPFAQNDTAQSTSTQSIL
jgi:Contractile injection system tube protein